MKSASRSATVASKRYGMNIINYEGCILPSFICADRLNWLRQNFNTQKQDVFIACYPKSGTNYLLKLCMEIMAHHDKENCHPFYSNGIWRNIPWIEQLVSSKTDSSTNEIDGIDKFLNHCQLFDDEDSSLRFWNTHLPLNIFPANTIHSDTKIMYICRNPKDLILSSYAFYSNHPWIDFKCHDFNDYFNIFVAGLSLYDSWFKHVYHWYRYFQNSNDKQMLWLYYEDLRNDPMNELKKIAIFLNKELSDDDCKSIIQKSDIEEMRKMSEQGLVRYNPEFFKRGGKVDGWRNELTQIQIEILDDMTRANFVGTDIKYLHQL